MKSLRHGYCAILCMAAMLLTGCGGAGSLTQALPASQEETLSLPTSGAGTVPSVDFRGEHFSGRTKHVKCSSWSYGNHGARFSASGDATGPLPGAFTASGGWVWNVHRGGVVLIYEKFRLISGSQAIHGTIGPTGTQHFGTCRKFRSSRLPYQSGHAKGHASLHVVSGGDFEESFFSRETS